ncbi:hypothetical protein GOB99_29635 [Sinorhizobium meliloti]|nr:hypothetical protein [Sinorhizobium meliloti]MDX0203686.1 hypothetical protein [Sinorhizobium meliloti]MDX0240697.1 hypothetical protein [Sinorhizobium meliloti]MDX0260978.1 hypothetical protein [Sinorhizobium meliloti]MDX0352040.1 hypothetical protein [Sinorhizobium meliloti]
MDFYHTPGSSSQATHILLREAKLEFWPRKVDIFTRTLEDGSDYTRSIVTLMCRRLCSTTACF